MSAPPAADIGHFALDQRAFVRAFDRAGRSYDAAAWLQRYAAAELLERLQFFGLQPQCLLDLGAGTCHAAALLARRYPGARVLAADLSPGMLRAARRHWWRRQLYARVCADARALPLADHSVDLVYSNLMLQWCDRPEQTFGELARVLRPGGLLVFSSLGPQALSELRAAWGAADTAPHVTEFPDMAQLGAALGQAGFLEPVLDVESRRHHYADVSALARELRSLGAHNAASARARGLTGRGRWRAMTTAYEQWRTPQGLPATFELLFGAAFNGGGMRARGEHTVPLTAVRRRKP
jgi:malonyl-CoA O-methyltransferase